MNARRDTLRNVTKLHIEFHHQEQLKRAREENRQLRSALMALGVDPDSVLLGRMLKNLPDGGLARNEAQ